MCNDRNATLHASNNFCIDPSSYWRSKFIELSISMSMSWEKCSHLLTYKVIQLTYQSTTVLMNRVKNDASWCLFQSDPERREKLANSTKRYFCDWLLTVVFSSLYFSLFSLSLSLFLHVYVCINTHTHKHFYARDCLSLYAHTHTG